MSVVRVATAVATSVLTALAALTTLAAPSASAAPKCSDVEMVFARGTDEPPGLGVVGTALVDTLRPMVKGKSIGTYAVNYDDGDESPSLPINKVRRPRTFQSQA